MVSGTLQRAGGRLRIAAQLLRDGLGSPLWTASRDTPESDLFAAQDGLADELIATLGLDLSSGDRAELSRRRTDRPAAYRAFARGRYFWNKRAGRDLERAIEAFGEALEHDPGYARAHAGLADAYVLLPFYAGVDPRDAFPQARAAAIRALEIDERLVEAHTSLAYARFLYDWEFAGAEEAFARALELDPTYATARHWHGFYLSAMGRHSEAIAEMQRATELDPLSLVIQSDLALVQYFARRYEEAVAQAQTALELDERFAYAYFALCLASCQLQRFEEAVTAGEQAAQLSQRHPLMLAVLAHAMAVAGREQEARELFAELRRHRDAKPGHLALVEVA